MCGVIIELCGKVGLFCFGSQGHVALWTMEYGTRDAACSPHLMPQILYAMLQFAEQHYHCPKLLVMDLGEGLATVGDTVDEELLVHVQATYEGDGFPHLG